MLGKWARRVLAAAGVAVLVTTLGLLSLQILVRLFGLPLPVAWIQEWAMYSLVWIAFIGSAMAFDYKAHIIIDVVARVLPQRGQVVANVVVSILSLAFFVVVAASSSWLALESWHSHSPALGWSVGALYLVVPVSSAFAIVFLIRDIVHYVHHGSKAST